MDKRISEPATYLTPAITNVEPVTYLTPAITNVEPATYLTPVITNVEPATYPIPVISDKMLIINYQPLANNINDISQNESNYQLLIKQLHNR